MAYNRDNSKYGKFTQDFDDFSDNRVEFFLPDENIDFNVLASDLKCYLGNDAEVNIGNHPRNGRPGYYIKSAVAVTVPMIQDLKADSLRWRAERRQYNLKDYNESRTHEKRLKNGPSEKAPKVTSYKQGEGREQQDKFLQGPAAPQPIPKSRHEREDLYRNPTTMSSSPRSNLPPRTSSHHPSTIHHDMKTRSPSKGFKPPSQRHQEDASDLSAGSISVNYRQTETSIQVNESALRQTLSGNQYSTQPRYTEQQREEVEKQIKELLRAHGVPNPSQQYVDDLVKEQLRRLYGSQQQQSHQTPLSPTQGGQKPSSGSVPYTHFTGSSGQKPPPGSVPFTQFHGSGGKNPPPGSVPYTQFPGSDKPPDTTQPDFSGSYGSAPYTQFPGSDKPPDTTQPDFSGSYGFSHITSGGPESYLVDADDEGFSDQHYSQSYEPRSGKHSTRDGKDRKRR